MRDGCALNLVTQSLSKALHITRGAIMLRGEHEKSDRRSSSALDRGKPSRALYLPPIVASMPTFSHVQIWPSYAA